MLKCTLSVLLLCSFSVAVAQEAPPEQAAVEKAWMAFGKPGQEHQQLQRLVGKWSTVTTTFGPTGPSKSEGKAEFESLHGGRFVRQTFEGEMEGQKFTGTGVSGYDNAKKKFVGAWIDSMGTGIIRFEGTYDVKTNTLTETGVGSGPFGEMKWKTTTQYKSADEFLFTMFMLQGEKEMKMMEIVYSRKK